MNSAFNLLRHPMQARQQRLRWRLGSGLVGVLLGLVGAAAALHGLQQDLAALTQERERLLAQTTRQRAQAKDDQARLAAQSLALRQHALLVQVQQHQQAWVRLHQAVLQEAGRNAWSLERLQVDGDRLELQGRTRDVQALMQVQARLAQQLQSPLTLVSLVAPAADPLAQPAGALDHVFVWQGPWPALSASNRR